MRSPKEPKPLPPLSVVESALKYCHESGVLTWARGRSGASVGSPAGSVTKGYIRLTLNYQGYQAHRLAWLLFYKEEPNGIIDHINGDGTDNRISNLRITSRSGNVHNRRDMPFNTSGYRGVYQCKRSGLWIARIRKRSAGKYANGTSKKVFLGLFKTPQDASVAYEKAAAREHGDFYYKKGVGGNGL